VKVWNSEIWSLVTDWRFFIAERIRQEFALRNYTPSPT